MQSEAFMKQTLFDEEVVKSMKIWQEVATQISLDQMKALGIRVGDNNNVDDVLEDLDESALMQTLQNITCHLQVPEQLSKKEQSSVINNPQEQALRSIDMNASQSPSKIDKLDPKAKEFMPSHRKITLQPKPKVALQQQNQSTNQNQQPEQCQHRAIHQSPILVLHENINQRVIQLIQSGCFEYIPETQGDD